MRQCTHAQSSLPYTPTHHSDLKPDNIGFSREKECVKIFDFGLAVKLAPGQKCKGRTGTILYMAPEVGSPEGYDFPADVYSFGILLWQIMTTMIPFHAELSACTGDASAMLKEIRPPLKNIESKELQSLLESCWAAKPEDRPTFTQIRPKLRSIADSSIVLPSKPAKKKGPPKVKRMLRASMFSR
jgi:serine/threonine protein kinase